MTEEGQQFLFSEEEISPWKLEWRNMPEFAIDDLEPKFSVVVNFSSAADVEDFGKAIGQKITANHEARQLQSVWFPAQEIGRIVNKRYKDGRK